MSDAKDIRKQVRNVIQENLDELLTKEVVAAIEKQLHEKFQKLETNVKEDMKKMNDRHKDVMSYLVRQVSKPPTKE